MLSGCITATGELDSSDTLKSSWVRPDDPQEKIGAKEHPAVVAKYGGTYENRQAERLVAVIVGKLVSQSEDPSRVYKITLLDSPKVNAFALPGGFLYVTRGLMALANDSSELAAVIAHEMAHVSSNHAIIRQEKMNSAALGKKVVSDVLDDSPAGQIAIAANQLKLRMFSQDQELQADAVGIRTSGRAGYDPFAAARFLETMERYRQFILGSGDFGGNDSFASSHPSTPKRIELARRHGRFFGSPGIGKKDRDRYLRGIDGILYGNTSDEGFIRGQTFLHAGLGIAFDAPKGFVIDNQKKAVLISGPDDLATRFDATVVSKRTSLSDYLKSGWITGLVNETIREELTNGFESATAIARGDSWRFKVRVIRNDNQVYRFITAAPQTNTNIDAVSRRITGSFRTLSEREIANLEPLRIRIKTAGSNDTIATFANQMRGSSKPGKLFRLLNGLKPGDSLQPGQKVKIVTDR
jgi:predicted Zn-dependent protease